MKQKQNKIRYNLWYFQCRGIGYVCDLICKIEGVAIFKILIGM